VKTRRVATPLFRQALGFFREVIAMSGFQRFVGGLMIGGLVWLAAAIDAPACDEICAERADGSGLGDQWVPWGDDGSAVVLNVGDPARLFDSLDEELRPVSMAAMIDGRPLVLVVGSCS